MPDNRDLAAVDIELAGAGLGLVTEIDGSLRTIGPIGEIVGIRRRLLDLVFIDDIAARFGGGNELRSAVSELQRLLYTA